jgi:hypothetical protein
MSQLTTTLLGAQRMANALQDVERLMRERAELIALVSKWRAMAEAFSGASVRALEQRDEVRAICLVPVRVALEQAANDGEHSPDCVAFRYGADEQACSCFLAACRGAIAAIDLVLKSGQAEKTNVGSAG